MLALPTAERARLAQRLIASLDEDESEDPQEVERAWEEEIRRRLAEVEAGSAELIPADDVFAELRARSHQ
ncbi:MAG: addiction module protein [Gemmatimonadota bacterium]|nr:addiction module protein [Gemmatimonadota bacterium]